MCRIAGRPTVMSRAAALHHVTPRPSYEPLPQEPRVLAAGLTRHQRAHLGDGLRRRAHVVNVESFAEADRMVQVEEAFDVAVIPPHDAAGRDAVGLVEQLARRWPDVAIVVFCPPPRPGAPPPPLRALLMAGAHQVVFEGVEDTTRAVAAAVENAQRLTAAEQVLGQLMPLVPVRLYSLVNAVLADPELTSVSQAASALGVHRKTLVNRCSQCGFLQPGEVITWTRLAMVGYMLGRTGRTVESISLSMGFPSHTALRNQLKRYTGRTATEIREAGGLPVVIQALGAKLPIT